MQCESNIHAFELLCGSNAELTSRRESL